MKKLLRFHKDIFHPSWASISIIEFCVLLSQTKLKYSYHAVNKLRNLKKQYKSAIKYLVNTLDFTDENVINSLFEFSSNSKNQVRKASFRFSLPELDSDLILVISASSKIITLYLNGINDLHETLNQDLYEKGDNIESQITIEG